jgi:hypothetical protein
MKVLPLKLDFMQRIARGEHATAEDLPALAMCIASSAVVA